MIGWKLCSVLSPGEYVSLFPMLRENVHHYFLGSPTSAPDAPLFFFADGVTASEIVPRLNATTEFALLRVEAGEPVRQMEFCAQAEADIPAFWESFFAGEEWPGEKSYKCWPGTLTAAEIKPVAVAWAGFAVGDRGELIARIAEGMAAIRGDVVLKPSLFFPVARA